MIKNNRERPRYCEVPCTSQCGCCTVTLEAMQGTSAGTRGLRSSASAQQENYLQYVKGNCYGCGAPLQTSAPESPGYVENERYEVKRKHRQVDQLICGYAPSRRPPVPICRACHAIHDRPGLCNSACRQGSALAMKSKNLRSWKECGVFATVREGI